MSYSKMALELQKLEFLWMACCATKKKLTNKDVAQTHNLRIGSLPSTNQQFHNFKGHVHYQ